MADKMIGELPRITSLSDDAMFVAEQQGTAGHVTGYQFKSFAKEGVESYVEEAKSAAEEAKKNAEKSENFAGKAPKIINNTWWVWNPETGEYEDSGTSASVAYATFEVDPRTGELIMTTPDGYTSPGFQLVNGYLEVSING